MSGVSFTIMKRSPSYDRKPGGETAELMDVKENQVINAIKRYFVCLAPFWFYLFDVVLLLLGVKYEGMEESGLLITVGVFVFAGIGVVYSLLLLRYPAISMEELGFFAVLVLFFLLYAVTGLRLWGNAFHLIAQMRKSVLYCFILVISLHIVRRQGWFDTLFGAGKFVSLIATVAVAIRMLPQLTVDWHHVEYYGSFRYQSMGYYCTVIAVLLEVSLLATRKTAHRIIYGLGVLINFAALLLTGARGAMIAFILVSIFIAAASVKRITIPLLLRIFLIAFLLAVVVLLAFAFIPEFQVLLGGATRTFNYISDAGISLDNREGIFSHAVIQIRKSPVFGHGVGASYKLFKIFPHNMFLEFMIDGGLVYTVFMAFLMGCRIIQWSKCFRTHTQVRGIYVVILINLCMLLLSGSYYVNPWFWLFVSFNPKKAFIKERAIGYGTSDIKNPPMPTVALH